MNDTLYYWTTGEDIDLVLWFESDQGLHQGQVEFKRAHGRAVEVGSVPRHEVKDILNNWPRKQRYYVLPTGQQVYPGTLQDAYERWAWSNTKAV